MKLLTLRYLLFFLLAIYSLNYIEVYSQDLRLTLTSSTYNQSNIKLKIKENENSVNTFHKKELTKEFKFLRSTNNLKNFPFRFTTEIAAGNFMEEDRLKLGFITSLEISIYNRIWFLKIEYGQFYNISYEEIGIHFGALGINYRIFKIKKNSFSIHGALFAIGNKHNGGSSFYISLRHIYSLNNYIGIVSCIKYPIGSFKKGIISTGIQIFTK